MNYDIHFNILNYNLFYSYLSHICNEKNNKFSIDVHEPIGFSDCGFPILHYSIGNGPYEVLYMGGAHGNEIIGVDFILQLMRNMALGNGKFCDFDPNLFTVHFIPVQNPEGFFTTTYALDSVLKDKSSLEKEDFCRDYYLNYRSSNGDILNIQKLLDYCVERSNSSLEKEEVRRKWWNFCRKYGVTFSTFCLFLKQMFSKDSIDYLEMETLWNQYFMKKEILLDIKEYQKPFLDITLDVIPELTTAHKKLKDSLKHLYSSVSYPNHTLANFLANGNGVNLNENNPYYFQELKERVQKEREVWVAPIYGSYWKHVPGPYGVPSESEDFKYATENMVLMQFLEEHKDRLYAFVNCHGTGGLLYYYPYFEETKQRDFSFYINNRLATEYLKEVQVSYGKEKGYQGMGHPSKISGVGDFLRARYPGHLLVELSKAGGNPLGPYIEPNYTLTMISNMNACMALLQTILTVEHLYGKTYEMSYNVLGSEMNGSRLKKM